jgi:hypothetical protein
MALRAGQQNSLNRRVVRFLDTENLSLLAVSQRLLGEAKVQRI